eukprot:Transcript_315.p2 GENE.Transcript_315~~Transcript_315.p2  ORF type:complete len:151 (-),score=65.61 Transcript_315:131-583(-)
MWRDAGLLVEKSPSGGGGGEGGEGGEGGAGTASAGGGGAPQLTAWLLQKCLLASQLHITTDCNMSYRDAELAFTEWCEALLRLACALVPPAARAEAGGAAGSAAAAALRALLARLARGWEGRSNRWARDARYRSRVETVRDAFRCARDAE